MTEKLYDKNAYLFEFDAQVLSCTETKRGFETILDRTAFFPGEGGQDCDSGMIGGARVNHVSLLGNKIVHLTDAEVSGHVRCTLDGDTRFDRMQQHTGEHIVCGIVHRLYGYENVGFHLGDDETTFDFDGPLTKKQLSEIEVLANRTVTQNLSVRGYYPSYGELAKLDYRSKKEIDGDIRIVEIEGIDRCACCAPHVAKTGEIGLIKFTDSMAYKGGIRIHMVCGMRALRDYSLKQENLELIARDLSCKPTNAAEFFKKFTTDAQLLKQTVSGLRQLLILLKCAAVEKTDGNIILFEDKADTGALRLTVNALDGKYGKMCAVLSGSDEEGYSFAAAGADGCDMRDTAKILRKKLNARCGGSDKMIQGSISAKRREIESFFGSL